MKQYKYNLAVAITDDLVKINDKWYLVLLDPEDTGRNDEWNGSYTLREVSVIPAGNGNWVVGMLCGKDHLRTISVEEADHIKLDNYVDMCCTLPGTPLLGHYLNESYDFKEDMLSEAKGKVLIQ